MDDAQANPPTVADGRMYLVPWAHLDAGFEPAYYHHNHLGTTRLLSQESQQGHDLYARTYTAFGEPIAVLREQGQ